MLDWLHWPNWCSTSWVAVSERTVTREERRYGEFSQAQMGEKVKRREHWIDIWKWMNENRLVKSRCGMMKIQWIDELIPAVSRLAPLDSFVWRISVWFPSRLLVFAVCFARLSSSCLLVSCVCRVARRLADNCVGKLCVAPPPPDSSFAGYREPVFTQRSYAPILIRLFNYLIQEASFWNLWSFILQTTQNSHPHCDSPTPPPPFSTQTTTWKVCASLFSLSLSEPRLERGNQIESSKKRKCNIYCCCCCECPSLSPIQQEQCSFFVVVDDLQSISIGVSETEIAPPICACVWVCLKRSAHSSSSRESRVCLLSVASRALQNYLDTHSDPHPPTTAPPHTLPGEHRDREGASPLNPPQSQRSG